MIIKFRTIRASTEEAFERSKQEEMSGITSLPFAHEHDYFTDITVEMDSVIDYVVGKIFFNGTAHECVYARLDNDEYTDGIVISADDFQKIFEYTKQCSIKTSDEILKRLRDESNSTGI